MGAGGAFRVCCNVSSSNISSIVPKPPGKIAKALARIARCIFLRMSGHPALQHALRNRFFDALGLPRNWFLGQLNSVEPARYGPVCPVVWAGRRRETPPIPINPFRFTQLDECSRRGGSGRL